MFHIIFTILSIAAVLDQGVTYRILGVFPFNSYSHEMIFEALMKGLAKRGHQVDVVTHFPPKNPPLNYKIVVNLKGTRPNLINNFTIDFIENQLEDLTVAIATLHGNNICELMGLRDMQNIIHNPPKDPPYDIFITEAFAAHCFMGIGYHFKIPIVAISSSAEYPWISELTGNNDNLAVVPNYLTVIFGQMNFWQRLKNLLTYHNENRKFYMTAEHVQTEAMRKYINPNIPNIREIEKSVALTLINSHPILDGIKSVLPRLLQIGGLHIGEANSELPMSLKKWMDDSKEGVIYFTFGSMVLIETLPENILKILYSSFAKLKPARILMKIANQSKLPSGLPENVLTLPWIPQQSILAHNNTRVFITHGGLLSTQEAVYYGVPMIGIPLFADQPRNIESFVAKNMAIKLFLRDITEDTFDTALKSILFDPKYRKYAKHYSKLFRDLPQSATDQATFWIEYVVRNGPNILRSPAFDLTWWQLAMLDIYGFIFAVSILTIFILYYIFKYFVVTLLRLLLTKGKQKEKKIK